MPGQTSPLSGREVRGDVARERLRRAVEDGERLYRQRMHEEPHEITGADENRINGILTIDLPDALGVVDRLRAALVDVLDVAERMHGGDESLTPEQWYAARDFARQWVGP